MSYSDEMINRFDCAVPAQPAGKLACRPGEIDTQGLVSYPVYIGKSTHFFADEDHYHLLMNARG